MMAGNYFEFATVMASPEDIPPHLRAVVVAYRLDRNMTYDGLANCLRVSTEGARALIERMQRRACWSSNLEKLLLLSSDIGPVSTTGPDGHWTGSFRFMELPPEIRERIYGHVVTPLENHCLNYARFRRPSILAVSKQVKQEAKAIFYSENNFEIDIVSNFECRQSPHIHNVRMMNWPKGCAGATGKAGNLLQDAEMASTDLLDMSLFRKITFRVYDVQTLADISPFYLRFRSPVIQNSVVTLLSLQWSGTHGLQLGREEGPNYPIAPKRGAYWLRAGDVDATMEEVEQVATTVAGRDVQGLHDRRPARDQQGIPVRRVAFDSKLSVPFVFCLSTHNAVTQLYKASAKGAAHL